MARETKEQKELRRAAEEHAALIAKQAFRESMPERLVEIQRLAMSVGIRTEVRLTGFGPEVRFNDNDGIDETLSYNSEEWEVESLVRRLNETKAEQDARAARHKLAQDLFNTLTAEQKLALKENMRYLV